MSDSKPSRRLTDLELQIMQVVWDAVPEPRTVRAVVEELERRGRPLAYTTVQTMLNILHKKGVLERRPGSGRANEYRPRVSRGEAMTSMTRDLVERMFGGRAQPLVAHLLESEQVSREELETLKRLIETQLHDEEASS